MNAVAQAPTPMSLDVSDTRPIPFWRTCLVEFRKSFNTRAGFWYLIAMAALILVVQGIVLTVLLIEDSAVRFDEMAGVAGTILLMMLPILAIMVVSTEWTQRSAMVTFTLEPRRARVILAKFAISLIWVAITIALMFLIAFAVTGVAELARPDLTVWEMPSLRDLAYVCLEQVTAMWVGFALAALLLNTPAAIVAFLMYWWVLPFVVPAASALSSGLGDALEWINFRLALAPFSVGDDVEWGKVMVSAAVWIGIPLALGVRRILRAEIK